ncbi:hypothetical protein DV713_20280 (plasmid) [Parageobacillus thermoglucosidasius]|nr:hypothetical protein DV713_20280 [Parageobacillus thermoglucosidasius]
MRQRGTEVPFWGAFFLGGAEAAEKRFCFDFCAYLAKHRVTSIILESKSWFVLPPKQRKKLRFPAANFPAREENVTHKQAAFFYI